MYVCVRTLEPICWNIKTLQCREFLRRPRPPHRRVHKDLQLGAAIANLRSDVKKASFKAHEEWKHRQIPWSLTSRLFEISLYLSTWLFTIMEKLDNQYQPFPETCYHLNIDLNGAVRHFLKKHIQWSTVSHCKPHSSSAMRHPLAISNDFTGRSSLLRNPFQKLTCNWQIILGKSVILGISLVQLRKKKWRSPINSPQRSMKVRACHLFSIMRLAELWTSRACEAGLEKKYARALRDTWAGTVRHLIMIIIKQWQHVDV